MGVKSARDRARAVHPEIRAPRDGRPRIGAPGVLEGAPTTSGWSWFGRRSTADLQIDIDAYRAAIDDSTVLLVASAPSLTLGMVDPIAELAPLALERDINFHVDSCVGGFFLPFAEKLGYPVPTFDFRVPGVTTISADLHKFGYTAKGASLIMSRDPEIYRHQSSSSGLPNGRTTGT